MEKIFEIIKVFECDLVTSYIYQDDKYFTYEYGLNELINFWNVNCDKLVLKCYNLYYDSNENMLDIKIYFQKLNGRR